MDTNDGIIIDQRFNMGPIAVLTGSKASSDFIFQRDFSRQGLALHNDNALFELHLKEEYQIK